MDKNIPMQTRMMPVATVNEEARTVELVWAAGAVVSRYDWWTGERYDEALSMAPDAVDLTRLNNGAPLLNSHRQHDLADVIGVVERAWIENGEGRAIVRFSERDEVAPLFADVKAGIIRNVSVGYRVNTYQIEKRDGSPALYTAVDWEPMELSLVPIPADSGAGTRGAADQGGFPCQFVTRQPAPADVPSTSVTQGKDMPKEDNEIRGAAPGNDNADAETRAAVQAERERGTQIRSVVEKLGLDQAFADKLIADGVSLDAARAAAIDERAARAERTQPRTGSARFETVTDETETRRSAVQEALLHRFNPGQYQLTDAGRQYRGMNLIDMARDCLEAAGVRTRGMERSQIAEMAMRGGGYHSTGDFPIILGNTVNRTLRDGYALAPRTFLPFCRQTTARDFRPMTRAALSDITAMQKIRQGGEYQRGSVGESSESYGVSKWGEVIAITWETLINDDLDAFTRIPLALGAEAAQTESDVVWGIITGNPTMSDSVALFHTTHNNLAGAGASISVTSLSAARAAMRKQTAPKGRPLNLAPAFLLVGPDKELEANQYTSAQFVANAANAVNPNFNTSLQVIVESRLTGNQWYLSAAPGLIDTIEYAYLEGENGIYTETRNGFDVDGVEVKARLVFGAAPIDHRGLYKNPGA